METQDALKQETIVEDLTINPGEAEEVKAGAGAQYFLKVKGIDAEATSTREPSAPSVSEVVVTKIND